MKMSEIFNALTKEQYIALLSETVDNNYDSCKYCPLRKECRENSADGDSRLCAEFLNDMIEEDRGE